MLKNNLNLSENYIEYAIVHFQASQDGNYKMANKMYNELTKIYKYLEKNREFAQNFLKQMLVNPNDSVKLWAASHCLGLSILTNDSIKIIKEISQKDSKYFPSFEAKMTLKVWKEQGKLKF